MSIYANNIVYSLNNLARLNRDAVGQIYIFQNYASLNDRNRNNFNGFKSALEPYMCYLPAAFYKNIGRNRYTKREDEDIYNILRTVSYVRQFCMHDMFEANNGNLRYNIFRIEANNNLSEIYEQGGLLDSVYSEKINQINNSFCNTSSKYLNYLFGLYDIGNDIDKKAITEEFYKYIILKDNNNIGFSIKKVREALIENNIATLHSRDNHEVNSIRHNLYILMDFVIYKHYCTETAEVDSIVSQLRMSGSNEDKERVYANAAEKLFTNNALWSKINSIAALTGRDIQSMPTEAVDGSFIDDVKLNTDGSSFSKIIYILTLFLDGKEINDLLTTLINKFENIQSFIDVMGDCRIEVNFRDDYNIFLQSGGIADELRYIKSFARMEIKIDAPGPNVSQEQRRNMPIPGEKQYNDAAVILGIQDQSELDCFTGSDHNVRNFIINNVINSSRFRYLVRFSNPENVRKLASNEKVVKFVLGRMPDSQLRRYMRGIGESDTMSIGEIISCLAGKISTMSFSLFANVRNGNNANRDQKIEKERLKALVGLYLTVLYNIEKNLVNVNARYTIAASFLERDKNLFDAGSYLNVAEQFADDSNCALKKKLKEQLKSNITAAVYNEEGNRDKLYIDYRNAICHLNVIPAAADYLEDINPDKEIKSYFGLYQYIMQRHICSKYSTDSGLDDNLSNDAKTAFVNMVEYKSYSKDLVKILNAPFGYVPARYKNLTTEVLFDMNENFETGNTASQQ